VRQSLRRIDMPPDLLDRIARRLRDESKEPPTT
jgi:hypothetical protein